MVDKLQIVAEARSWVGTRFHHQGRLKRNKENKGGCDCIGLIIGVADNLGITISGNALSVYDGKNYSKIPDGKELKKRLDTYFREISIDEMEAGDVLLFKLDKDPQHVGIVADYPGEVFSIVHCYLQSRGVVEHILDDSWKKKIISAYSIL